MLDAFSLCESAADLVGPTMEIFKLRRSKQHFVRKAKLNAITDAIMAKPKKFLNLSLENVLSLSGLNQTVFRHHLYRAVGNLGKPKCKDLIQVTVLETDDERVLRGD